MIKSLIKRVTTTKERKAILLMIEDFEKDVNIIKHLISKYKLILIFILLNIIIYSTIIKLLFKNLQ